MSMCKLRDYCGHGDANRESGHVKTGKQTRAVLVYGVVGWWGDLKNGLQGSGEHSRYFGAMHGAERWSVGWVGERRAGRHGPEG